MSFKYAILAVLLVAALAGEIGIFDNHEDSRASTYYYVKAWSQRLDSPLPGSDPRGWQIVFNVSSNGTQTPNLTLSSLFDASNTTDGYLVQDSNTTYRLNLTDLLWSSGCSRYYNWNKSDNVTTCRLNLAIASKWDWFYGNVSFVIEISDRNASVTLTHTSKTFNFMGVQTIFTKNHGREVGQLQTVSIFPCKNCWNKTKDFTINETVMYHVSAARGASQWSWMEDPKLVSTHVRCGPWWTRTDTRVNITFPVNQSNQSIESCYASLACASGVFQLDQDCDVGVLITNSNRTTIFPYQIQGKVRCSLHPQNSTNWTSPNWTNTGPFYHPTPRNVSNTTFYNGTFYNGSASFPWTNTSAFYHPTPRNVSNTTFFNGSSGSQWTNTSSFYHSSPSNASNSTYFSGYRGNWTTNTSTYFSGYRGNWTGNTSTTTATTSQSFRHNATVWANASNSTSARSSTASSWGGFGQILISGAFVAAIGYGAVKYYMSGTTQITA